MRKFFNWFATKTSSAAGQPLTFVIAVTVILVWAVTGPIFRFSDTWQLIINTGTTIVTFLMVFLIQNSQNRDGAAMQAKLDELLRALKGARDQFIGIEHLTDQQIELVRAALEKKAAELKGKTRTSGNGNGKKKGKAEVKEEVDTVDRLLDRF
jgi:low affinity Fe/Cu permease